MRLPWPFLLLVCFVAAVLGAILFPYFDNYYVADDFWHLSFIRFVSHPWKIFFRPSFAQVNFRPVAWMAEALLYREAGLSPMRNHVADAVLNGMNALLVSLLAWRLTQSLIAERFWRWAGAYLAGLLFAVHPIGLLTASWLCCRADLWAVFFTLAALLGFLHFRGRRLFLPLLTLLALLAGLSKETAMVLPGMIYAAAWLFPQGEPRGWRRWWQALVETVPSALGIGLYLGWRLAVLKGLGGYEPLQFRLSFLWPRLIYHLPRIFERAPRDLLFHHLSAPTASYRILAGFLLLLALFAGWGILRRRRLLLLALAWTALALAPLWNLSQMLVKREERLLYFALIGFALLAPATLAGLRRTSARSLALCLWILVLNVYGLADGPALRAWRQAGEDNRALSTALRQKLKELQPAPGGRRFYVLGLDADQYYLDAMVKLELPWQYLGNRFMLGDRPSLVWNFLPAFPDSSDAEPKLDARALPQEQTFPTDPQNHLVAATPPDLIFALQLDQQAAVWEWKGDLILDAGDEIRNLAYQVPMMLGRYSQLSRFLPTWSFYRGGLALAWSLSPDCRQDLLDRSEDTLAFIATGPDPYLVSPEVRFHAAGAKLLEIELKLPRQDYLPPDQSEGSLFWLTESSPAWSGAHEIRFLLQADGQWHTYRLELASNMAWVRSGLVRQLRLDPLAGTGRFWLKRIIFLSDAEAASQAQAAATGTKPPSSP
jgi:hypothetical protein